MPETTVIGVIDTAVKIGLGALISGVATHWVSKAKNTAEERNAFQLRYRNILEEVAQSVEVTNHVYLKYWALVVEWFRYSKGGHDWPDSRREELDKTKKELFHEFKEITTAESKLLLLSETQSAALLRTYAESVVEFRRAFYVDSMSMTEELMEEKKSEIRIHRESLFKLISEKYKHGVT